MGTLFYAEKIAAYLESINAFNFTNSRSSYNIQIYLKKLYEIELEVNEIRNIIDKHPFVSLSDGTKVYFNKIGSSFDFYFLERIKES